MKKTVLLCLLLTLLFAYSVHASPAPQGEMIVAMEADPYSMDPLLSWMTYGMVMMYQIYDTPVAFGPKGQIKPSLAKSWEQPDDLTWRFHLRKNVKFHNGYPFTAEDFKYTLERILDPKNKCRYRSSYTAIDKIVVVDDHTLELKLKKPDPLMLNRLAHFVRIVSKKWAEENGVETLRKHAMGTGPFKFVSWQRKNRLVLEANTEHFMHVPKVKRLIFRPIPEMASRIAELQAGGVHIITAVPPFMVSQLEKDTNIEVYNVLSVRAMYLSMDTLDTEELQDKRVRQALNYAVDKKSIIKNVLMGKGEPLGLSAPMHIPGIDQSIQPYPYDPDKAKALLKEAGYPEGFELKLYSPSHRYPMDKEVTQAVADQLSKVGIKPDIQVMETQKYFKSFVAHQLNGIFFLGHGFTNWNQDQILDPLNPDSPFCYYHNDEIKQMISKIRTTMNANERYEMAHKIHQIIHEETPMLFLYNQINSYGLSNKVKGFSAKGDDHFNLWEMSLND